MAEERIFVAELTGVQYTCGIGGICSGKCEESGKCGKGISRQEAIERMAKAMCRKDYKMSCDKCIYKNSNNCKTTLENWFIEDAEAALNALLEGNNER